MGLESRFDYSAIGDSVNVASRVEGESKVVGFDIVAAEATRAAVPDLAWLEAGSVQLKGKAQRLKIHILVGDAALAQTAGVHRAAAAHSASWRWLAGGGDAGDAASRWRRRSSRGWRTSTSWSPAAADDFASPA